MSKQITTTVVIPCYNDGSFIQETLDSLNAQTCKTLEIIIVDDASTDKETLEILKHLQEENLTVLFLEKNGGPAVARNKGISSAKGKYILPVDADDIIDSTYIEKAQKILDGNLNIGIVYCDAAFFGDKTGQWELPEYAFPEILVGNMIFATALYRKSNWEKVNGYNENMREGNEDYDFWLSLLDLGVDVYKIPETLFYYRIKASSRTTQLSEDNSKELDTYEQIFHNHKALYLKNIRVFFEELKKRQVQFIENDAMLHKRLQYKDQEIKNLHKQLAESHMQLTELHTKLYETGDELTYARSVIEFRDEQLQSLLLKNRVKKLIKTISPIHKHQEKMLTTPKRKNTNTIPYRYTYTSPKLTKETKVSIENFENKPLISIVMPVYNVDPKWLDLAIQSIENQWYVHWELCITDDKSPSTDTIEYLKNLNNPKIKIVFLEKNLNISGATNAALEIVTGEYIALMDNDDEITPDALYEMVKVINEKDADFIYSDEDFISTEGVHSNPHFKPDFSPDLLLSHNYITHFTCFKRALLDKVGSYHSEFDGAQDYDLFLRLTEQTSKIEHIAKVLYHWRMLETSTSANSEAKPEAIERGKAVLEAALKRRSIDATIEHGNMHHYFRVKYTIKNNPLVSIIIPFKDKPELLDMSINSILDKSTYQNYEIIGISNNSEEQETFTMMAALEKKDSRVKCYEYNTEFNYADINNHAINTYAKGEHVLLLNNDIEVITPEWIEGMLEHSQREEVGCVGAKLYYPDDTIQHAGIIIGLGGYAGHSHKMYPRESPGYFNRLNAIQDLSAVTAACLMVKKRIYQEVDGMDNVKFKVAYNDVDFCLRVIEKGYYNIFTPYSEMYHHESISRGYETTPEKITRFQTEKDALSKRHQEILSSGDPYYNPNLTHDKEDFSLCQTIGK